MTKTIYIPTNNSCPEAGTFPDTWLFENGLGEGATVFYAVTGSAFILQVILFLILAISFYRKCPLIQVPYNLWVTSLFATVSFLCLLMVTLPSSTEFLLLAYKVYEAIIIFRFVELQMLWYGGERRLMALVGEGKTMRFNMPPLCCCCFCCMKVVLTRRKLKFLRFCVYQIVYVQAFVLFMTMVLHFSGYKFNGINPFNPTTYFKILGKISFLTGFWALFVFYKMQSTFNLLPPIKFTQKFAVLKIMFILIVFQELIIDSLATRKIITCSPYFSAVGWGSIIHCSLLIVESSLLGLWSFILYIKYPTVNVVLFGPDEESVSKDDRPLGLTTVSPVQTISNSPTSLHNGISSHQRA